MSANDSHHETRFDRWAYRTLTVGGLVFAASIAAGGAYGFWNWLLTSPARCVL